MFCFLRKECRKNLYISSSEIMKKFIFKIFIMLLILCSLTLIVNYAYVYAKCDMNYDGDSTEKFIHMDDGIQISNTGSSHGMRSFQYDDIDQYKCFNFALTSQRLSYDYRLVSYYQDNLAENGVMFIPISYFSLFGKDETEAEDFKSLDQRYYKVLPPDMIKGYDLKTDIYVNYLPALNAYEKFFMPFVGYVPENTYVNMNSNLLGREAELPERGYGRYLMHVVDGKFDESGNRIINYNEVEALYGIIGVCQKKGIRPLLITTPYTKEYVDAVKENDPDFFNDFYAVIEEVTRATGAEYYDYSEDIRFARQYGLFLDADHLNVDGGKQFTEIIIEELVQ